MQSNLHCKNQVVGISVGAVTFSIGAVTRGKLWRLWWIYLLLCTAAVLVQLLTPNIRVSAFGLGLIFPGGGFVSWSQLEGFSFWLVACICLATLSVFALSVIIWFGTGNIVLPPLLWLGFALVATMPNLFGFSWKEGKSINGIGIFFPLAMGLITFLVLQWAQRQRKVAAPFRPASVCKTVSTFVETPSEISFEDLKKFRLLLDRALQPIEAFNGFEWRDQFQTGAIRYQINFASYAIAMAQHHYFPAATAYLTQAQDRLLAKQGQERIWRYWRYENAWGNLRLCKDPILRDNIMYSGFVAVQMALAEQSGSQRSLVLECIGQPYRTYDMTQICGHLLQQYKTCNYGLLACEPNWIYPLCNIITATALQAHSARKGRDDWQQIAPRFRSSLMNEFSTANGRFVAFRSSVTGIAAPAIGGSVMQAFPAFFLNSLFPDLAQHQWAILQDDLKGHDWRTCFWPIDVGNYGFSRASSYAASAAAAVEMGDMDTAKTLLDLLDEECPIHDVAGFPHRENASLWAHSLEMVARLGRSDGLRHIIHGLPLTPTMGPHLERADYREVVIASAHRLDEKSLRLVLYPVQNRVRTQIHLAGFLPSQHYCTDLPDAPRFQADHNGRSELMFWLSDRTQLTITPIT